MAAAEKGGEAASRLEQKGVRGKRMDLSRRSFLGNAAFAAGACALAADAGAASPAGKPLKVCVFSDLHYSPGQWVNSGDTSFLDRILARAERERCDFMIHLGDLVHNVTSPETKALVRKYNDFRITGYHCLGNHDQDGNDWQETCAAYRMPSEGYYSFDRGGFRFVVLDPNYFCNEPNVFIHHSKGNYFARVKGSTINWIPPAQMEWLKDTVANSPYPCVILSHQTFERRSDGVCNRHEVRRFFREINAKHPGRVRLVMNGHMHMDHLSVMENILWWDVNSANFQYYGRKHDKYPPEFVKGLYGARNNIGWTEPLSAILTLWPDGRVRIDGSKADYLFGITPEMAGYDACSDEDRLTRPEIQSAEFRL